GFGDIRIGVNPGSGDLIVSHLHDVVIESFLVISPDLQDVHETFVLPRNRLELLETAEFLVVDFDIPEGAASNNLDGSVCAQNVSRKPHLTKSPGADAAEQFVVCNA